MKQYTNTGNKDTRSGFGAGLLEAGRKNPDIVATTNRTNDNKQCGFNNN